MSLRFYKFGVLFISILFVAQGIFAQSSAAYKNAQLPIEKRAQDLVNRLSLAEKVALLGYNSKAVSRLGIPAYNWWNESLHGVARAGIATIFPQPIGMAASFNAPLIHEIANVISTEARAKYNLAIQKDRHLQYMGLTFWSPNVNIFRDPRWGRGHETYGEDPFLTAKMGIAFVNGMQGQNPNYLKAAATAKHFAVHSGPEAGRDSFNALVDEKDLRETYLYAFNALVNNGVESVMSAYNSVNGIPNSINSKLLDTILRKEWGFKGHVVTDCGALDGVFESHHASSSDIATAAAAIKAGINLDCSTILQKHLVQAVQQNLVTEKEVDAALVKLLSTQFKLGFYNEKKYDPFKNYLADSIHNASHIRLARKAAQQSMVLLKNNNQLLPIGKNQYESVMILGPNATSYDALIGNYHGVSDKAVNFVEGITAALDPSTRIEYDLGCDYNDTTHFGGIWAAGNASLTIVVLGLTPVIEGEAGDAFLSKSGGDKMNIDLPASEVAFMKQLRASVKTPIIAVVTAGSNINLNAIENDADAIVMAWYPGEQGGNAFGDILTGKIAPSGRLPITFYKSTSHLPAYTNYAMQGRTYRYFNGPVQYPFGYGLSYARFEYSLQPNKQHAYNKGDTVRTEIVIQNKSSIDAAEIVQAYIEYPHGERMPIRELKFFKRVDIPKGKSEKVQLQIPVNEFKKWDLAKNAWVVYPGKYKLILGANANETITSLDFEIK